MSDGMEFETSRKADRRISFMVQQMPGMHKCSTMQLAMIMAKRIIVRYLITVNRMQSI